MLRVTQREFILYLSYPVLKTIHRVWMLRISFFFKMHSVRQRTYGNKYSI